MSGIQSEMGVYRMLKNAFIDELEALDFDGQLEDNEDIKDDLMEELQEKVFEVIDNEIIYYHRCMEIVSALNYYHWDDNELGIEVKGINDVALLALYDFINEENVMSEAINEFLSKRGIQ